MAAYRGVVNAGTGAKLDAQIVIETRGLRLVGERDVIGRVSYDDMIVEIQEGRRPAIVVRSKTQPIVFITGSTLFLDDLIDAAGDAVGEHILAYVQQKKSSKRMGLWFGLFIGTGVLTLLAPFTLPFIAAASVGSLPVSVDQKIGESAQGFLVLGEEAKDPAILNAVAAIVARLEPQADAGELTFDVHVAHSPIVNAFALPGGRITITSGLIRAAASPDELAAVLAHEMAHVTKRHGLRAFVRSAGVMLAVDVINGDDRGLAALAAHGAAVAVLLKYSRPDEFEADREGLRTLVEAGFDGRAMYTLLSKTLKENDKDVASVPAWMSTHPALDERANVIAEALADMPAHVVDPLLIDWNAAVDAAW
jgi:beta-barrel assembly-enhancing protease